LIARPGGGLFVEDGVGNKSFTGILKFSQAARRKIKKRKAADLFIRAPEKQRGITAKRPHKAL
jgi:hypothetical protein